MTYLIGGADGELETPIETKVSAKLIKNTNNVLVLVVVVYNLRQICHRYNLIFHEGISKGAAALIGVIAASRDDIDHKKYSKCSVTQLTWMRLVGFVCDILFCQVNIIHFRVLW